MAKATNTQINGKDYYRINRKVGEKLNKNGELVSDMKVFYGHSKKEAEDKYKAYMAEKDCQKNPFENYPLNVCIDQWIDTFFKHSDLSDSTKKLYECNYRNGFRLSDVASLPLKEVTALKLQQFYNDCDLKYSNLKSIHKLLGHFYKYCELNGICPDATRPLTVPKKEQANKLTGIKEIEVWSDEDLRKVENALEGSTLRFLVILAVRTGARFSELLALTYNDIQDGVLTIDKQISEVTYGDNVGVHLSDTKTICSNRVIPLTESTLKELEKHKKLHHAEMFRNGYKTDLIFSTDNGNYYYKVNVRRRLNKLYKKIGVPQHTFHSFRHTFATNLVRCGTLESKVAELMGHSDTSITQKYYINIGHEQKLEALEQMEKVCMI